MLYRVQIRLELDRNYDLPQCLELWDFQFFFLSDISKIKVWKMKVIVPEHLCICQCTLVYISDVIAKVSP